VNYDHEPSDQGVSIREQGSSPELVLGEIWYGSHGLHIIGAPTQWTYRVFKKLEETRSESFNTQPEPRSTWRVSLKSERALDNFTEIGRSSTLGESLLAKHSGAAEDIWYHGYHESWTWRKGTGAPTMSWSTRPKDPSLVAHA
jgi:hypothetical protein